MSGVSIDSHSNIDLDAIVSGGDAFMARVKALQQAKSDASDALDSLSIGRDVVEAMRDAQAKEAAAMKMVEDAKAEAASIIAVAQAGAAEIAKQAEARATALVAGAQKQSDAIEEEVKVGRAALGAWSDKTTAEANTLMQAATQAMDAATQKAADNEAAAKKLAAAQKKADAALATAKDMQANLASKLEAIKAAAS